MTVAVRTETAQPVQAYPLRSKIAEMLQMPEAKALIVPLIPHGVSYEQVIVECFRATTTNPDILSCTQDSIFMAVGTAVQTGLLIGKTIHLVPVGDHGVKKLQAWTDYKGDIELVMRSGAAAFIDGQAVYENDPIFDYELGTDPWVKHRPEQDAKKRGRIKGFYAIANINRSGTIRKVVYMPLADVEVIRGKSKQWNPTKVAACPEWYGIKTTIHRVTKTIPRNPALAAALALFAHQDSLDSADDDLNPSNRIESYVPAVASEPVVEEPEWEPETPPTVQVSEAWSFPVPFGSDKVKGTPIGELTKEDLLNARAYAQRKGGFDEFLKMSATLLNERHERGIQ